MCWYAVSTAESAPLVKVQDQWPSPVCTHCGLTGCTVWALISQHVYRPPSYLHPSIFYTAYFIQGHRGLEPFPECIEQGAGCSPERSPQCVSNWVMGAEDNKLFQHLQVYSTTPITPAVSINYGMKNLTQMIESFVSLPNATPRTASTMQTRARLLDSNQSRQAASFWVLYSSDFYIGVSKLFHTRYPYS